MRTVRNITIAVEPELYRQTRRIAADYDTTVTDMVRFLLIALPEAVKAARYPGGRPQFGLAAARSHLPEPVLSHPGKKRNFALYACKYQSTTFLSATYETTTGARTG
jgi:hypothetical protein